MIPYGRQDISDEDIEEVIDVLRSDFITQGPLVPRFEESITNRIGVKYGIAVNSATSALHIACMSLGLGPGDILWTVPNTFVASANCGLYCGAKVDFVDIDPVTWNMSVDCFKDKLIDAKKHNCLPKIVIPVHFAGQPTEQETIWELAQEFGVRIIEDASHSIGASRNNENVGSCRWSDITIFSFHPVKIITTAEGGIAVTNDEELDNKMRLLRSHGITKQQDEFINTSPGPWYYEQQMLGFNYRMSDIHAALGISQLSRLDEFIEKRNTLAKRYNTALKSLVPVLKLPVVLPENLSSFHLYVVRLKDTKNISKKDIYGKLYTGGVGVNVHYIPVYLQPYYQQFGFKRGQFPESDAHSEEAITLPLYPALTTSEQDKVVEQLEKAFKF